ncbi:MAG: C40 family peptidase [Lachnospiraceae bacterium]|nr:C40 family peptidase [Lachnospiraceae bacterium]
MADPQSAVRTASQIAGAAGGTVQIASVGLPVELAENAADFQAIQSELSYLQDSLAEKTGQYESYQNLITEQKEAEAAQIAQREALRRDIVGNALQYVGNRYVYGGNDPNTGVDCSGFTRYVLGNTAGVYLNRTAASQSTQGQAVSAEEARPGDLVFYSNGGGVNHVAIYIGDGQVVHASNERTGIITSDMYYRTPVRIMNVLGD